MKHLIIFTAALILTGNLYAQTGFRITYSSFKYEHLLKLGEMETDIKTLIIINDSAAYKYYAKDTANNDSNYIYNLNYVSHSDTYVKSRDQWFFRISKKKNSKWGLANKINIDWRVMKDSTKNVLGFTCTKAWGLYKGTVVYAWFTQNIPGHFGPMSGTRYPGIALEVYMLQFGRAFIATSVEKGNYKISIPKNLPQQKNTP